MQTLEQFDAATARKRAELVAASEVLARCPTAPVAPVSCHMNLGGAWVKYEVQTLAEALAIVRAFGELRHVSARESGCLSINPDGQHGKQYADVAPLWEIPECIELCQHGGRGFYSPEIVFYPVAPAARVYIEIKAFPYQYRATMDATYSEHGKVAKATLREPDALLGMYTERVKYSGGSADAFDYRLYFSGPDHFADIVNALKDPAA